MENMEVYNRVKSVPQEARKPITGGRLNGMTDIKPMWRIEKLTEVFGMCGIGWKAPITNKEIIEGANGEKIAIVDIDLYVKVDGEWSEAIQGTGGSSFVSKENKGLYTSDECFKMAYTDALSVACKSLGVGADVYWGDSKYKTSGQNDSQNNTTKTNTSQPNQNKVTPAATPNQLAVLNKLSDTNKTKIYEKYNVKALEELNMLQASEIIGLLRKSGNE